MDMYIQNMIASTLNIDVRIIVRVTEIMKNKFKYLAAILLLSFITVILTSYLSRILILKSASDQDKSIDWFAPYQQTEAKKHYKILILSPGSGYMGLQVMARKITVAANNLGWDSHIAYSYDIEQVKQLQPDFIISLLWQHNFNSQEFPVNIYAYFVQPDTSYFGATFNFYPRFKKERHSSFDHISAYLFSFKSGKLLKDYVEKKKTFHGFKTFPVTHKTEYKKLSYDKLIYFGQNWDKSRSSNRFKLLFKKLEKDNIISVYGPKSSWTHLRTAWKGEFRDNAWEAINLTHKHGISLIIHTKRNNSDAVPSTRIFESAAASSIIITDKNKFVQEHFGDTVLYFDSEHSSNHMYQEIKKHFDWIKENPDKAENIAKKSHKIFISNFTLEQELTKIAKMHETISANNPKSQIKLDR